MDRTFINIKDRGNLVEFVKYAIVGCINTADYYLSYLVFIDIFKFSYRTSFVLGYVVSILGSYFLNTYFTYKQKPSVKKFLIFPLTYIPNFIIQYLGIILLVDRLNMSNKVAPVIAAIVATPITFFVMKYVIKNETLHPSWKVGVLLYHGGDFMEDRIVKLKGLELENFKNVKYGKIDFKEDKETGKISNILGIYGQNGSGKTSVINALYLFRMVISGQKLNPNFCNFISCEKNSAALGFEFRIIDKGETYRVFYKFELRKTYKSGAFSDDLSMEYNEMIDLSENIGNNVEYNKVTHINNSSEMNLEDEKVLGMDEHRIISAEDDKDITVEVFREKLSYSKWEENQWRKSITIVDYDMDDEDYTFRPIKNYREAANSTDKKVGFGIAKGLSQENSTSFIFSPKTFSLLLTSFAKTSPENSKILAILRNFAIFNIFVIQNDELGAITSNRMIPLSFMLENKKVNMRGNIGLKLFDVSVIDMNKLETVKKILEQINVVLNTLVPKLKIEIKNYGKETLNNSKEAFKVELLSVRNGRKIPLKYESEGIKKIISILSVLIGMYNNENILVAVDELDAGIFEYLLGEVLEILSKSAKGQLIFTSHNLRALEKLNKDLVVFTTTNENNRYISLNNAKVGNNLRDFYYRGIMLGGQKEDLYDETNKYEINYAFRKAWMIGNGNS